MSDRTSGTVEPIAIIGSSCRFPGGTDSPSKLWELLKHPVDLLTEIPPSRFNPAGFYHENAEHPGTTNVTKGYFLENDPWAFDNDFFNISAREAESMDPQQRVILETVYESIESAGYSISRLRGSSTGVFLGQMADDYRDLLLRDIDCHPQHAATGTSRSIVANRVSYTFDWKGPSMNIDTACSSSLVALHLAVQSLRNGESEMAVVAGTNLMMSPEFFGFVNSLRMLSPTGSSRMWDASADGYARGEGFAVVVIKTLKRALEDGDDVESIIRNTGVNQDGRSTGLTVPNAASQSELMKSTYARCGLDCGREEDRCQYFEAHGTGTQAGDPKEAEGISTAFFPNYHNERFSLQAENGIMKNKIHVGSIKTVIGHLEGTAGLASLLKASQAVQHGLIPPNLHFNQLNPAIEPYYHGLEVAMRLQPWPKLPEGVPRRASVNSFGFGGTNSHAILESWVDPLVAASPHSSSPCWGPFILSAHSEKSLAATISTLSATLERQSNIDISSLAWTLQTRRTQFMYRASFSATSKEELIARLDSSLRDKEKFPIAIQPTTSSYIRILGVFTGQGAQWATMGASLYLHSEKFRNTIQKLDIALKDIPESPDWSLAEELLEQHNPVRTSSAEISQPLCTALQVALVDLLKECGIMFSAVVGHSSGEIAAAYAAGVLSAEDSIKIAFYRGHHSRQIQNASTMRGKMMAVDMAPEDAEVFCRQTRFSGRINVAAKNSPSCVTLSGDSKAIEEAKMVLHEQAAFARTLKVDTAYHSHHMECVREAYFTSLKDANIQPIRNCFGGSCNWYSSVYGPDDSRGMYDSILFEHMYWVENMVNPVLFSDAISSAVQKEQFDLALEVGPHPALRGPAAESIKDASGSIIRYQGVLERNKDALDTFSSALGFVWSCTNSPDSPVDFGGFRRACDGPNWTIPRVYKGLPSYPWDHDRPMLKESKRSKTWRSRSTPFHELLGYPSSSFGHREIRWRNILRIGDVEWLRGHQFQNHALLPAASYLAMALNAAVSLGGQGQPIQLVELQDVVIHNGVSLEEGSPGVDINFVIRLVEETSVGKTAEFSCYSSNVDTASPEFDKEVFTGRAFVKLGAPVEDALPSRIAPDLPMKDVAVDRFYSWMQKVGLQYSGPFVLDSIKRRLNLATVTTKRIVTDQYTIHPATLDSIVQSLFVAFSYPGDGRMWTTYLPKSFRRVHFDMHARQQTSSQLVADCYLSESSAREISGDIDVFSLEDNHAEIQIQGAVFASLETPAVANDRGMFWRTVWKRDILSSIEPDEEVYTRTPLAEDRKLHEVCERTAYFYLRQLLREVGQEEMESKEWYFQCLMHWALEYVFPAAQSGKHSRWKMHWENDTVEPINMLVDREFEDQIDIKLIHQLGQRLPSIVRGSVPILQVLKEDDMLDRLYTEGLGFCETNSRLGLLLDQIVHRYPRMRVLEIGAGTGGSTSIALKHLGIKLEDYTFTDVSPGFFPAAEARFAEHENVMTFKVLDIEQSPVEQGFQAHSYDLIIAAHVLHATKSISETVQHCRELLRPGGYLILLELTSSTTLRTPFLFSGFPGWWLGREDGRIQSPMITESQWDAVLRENLFSGVDHSLRDFEDDSLHTFSAIVSQAVDERIDFLRDPLYQANDVKRIEKLLIIGGHSLTLSKMANKVQFLLSPFVEHTKVISTLEDVIESRSSYHESVVICLSDLEGATFAQIDRRRISAIHALFCEAKYILWATRGCRSDDPYANMIVGLGRSATREMAHLRLKFVDVDRIRTQKQQPEATMFCEMLLQMIYLDLPSFDDILWSNETEVAVVDGTVLIPRVVLDHDLNTCFNSARRAITKSVSPISTVVELSTRDASIAMEEIACGRKQEHEASFSPLQVVSSSLFQFACTDGSQPFYICLGLMDGKNENYLAISETNSSITPIAPDCAFVCKASASADETLASILTVIMCESILSGCVGLVWVHDADDCTARIISHLASHQGVSVFLSTSKRTSALIPTGMVTYVHPQAPERELRSRIPRNIRRFVNMGVDANGLAEFATTFTGHKMDVQPSMQNFSVREAISLSYDKSKLVKILTDYCFQPDFPHITGPQALKNVVKADIVHEQPERATPTSIISWTDIQSIQVQVMPATKSCHPFAIGKTYFLVGLTGDLGLSLCQWMADHGAKYIAIASRRPNVPPEIVENFQENGVVVRVFSLDVTDMENLTEVHQEIISSMPPIAGVANAALVMRDCPFDGMSFEDLEAVLKPKVTGSENLDKLFFSTPLDFFILFSSVTSITGRPGQANYNAANMFMSTLAERRRRRGLAASVMHFGMLLGLGFVHGQAGPTVEAKVRQDDFEAISEADFHEIFAQAILSGRADSGLDPQLIAGLGTAIETSWRYNPRFWHCRVKGEERLIQGRQRDQYKLTQSLQDQLIEANDGTQALSILKVAIASRVSLALGSPGAELNENVSFVALGIDSLVAVEIRSWLLATIKVDYPALKFLSGVSLLEICQEVLVKFETLRPRVNGNDKDDKKQNGETSGIAMDPSDQEPKTRPKLNGIHNTAAIHLEVPNGISKADKEPGQIEYERIGDMSLAQAQLFFLHEYLQTNAYNIAYFGHFHGQLDIKRLQTALRVVGKRHEAIRSAYFMDVSTMRPVQAVLREPQIELVHRTIQEDSEVHTEIETVKESRFEIEKGVVMKVTALSYSTSLHFILFTHHHIALDGASWSVFLADLANAYSGRVTSTAMGTGIPQCIEMAKRQQKALKHHDLYTDLAFWKEIYQTIPEPLPLFPFAKVNNRPAVKDYNVIICDVKLSGDLTKLVEGTSAKIGVTAFHFYIASFVTFLARCLGIGDVAVGLVDANRNEAEDMRTIGYFLNMLPVRIMLDHSEQFNAVARRSRDAVLAALGHSLAPLDMILDNLGVSKSTEHHPLFQVAVNYRKGFPSATDFGSDGSIEWEKGVPGGHPYDMLLNIAATSDWTYISFVLQRNLFEASDGELLLKWYTRALEALARDPDFEVGRCPVSDEADIAEAIRLGRGRDVEVPWKGTLTDRVEEVAAKLPESIAIKDGQSETLTYSQMTSRMIQITHQLQAVTPSLPLGSHVAMLLDPVADAVCCILAILRLGFVWIPLDTRNHHQRLHAVVEESRPRVLLCHNATEKLAQQISADTDFTSILSIDNNDNIDGIVDDKYNTSICQDTVKTNSNRINQPAMILYTSGSTGVPKGVVLTHGGLVNQIYGTITTLSLERETTLQQSPLGFDLMLDQIFLAICNGGTIVIVGKSGRGDPIHMANLMVKHGVTLTHFVPSEYLALLNYGHHILTKSHSWRYAMSGGEKLGRELHKAFRKLDSDTLNLVNVYGPAEITVACARGIVPLDDVDDNSSIDYLLPSPNYSLEITDADMNILPVGFPGEICISGQGVGIGYLQRVEESSYKFTQRKSVTSPSSVIRIYRSGDKGRILPNGTLKVLGRLDGDSQVKINGFRVELDEIANAIVNVSKGAIVNAAASLRVGQPTDILVAFVVFDVEFTGNKSDFIEWLQPNIPLPPVMKPTFIIPTERIPATANGKTDRRAVDKLHIAESGASSNEDTFTNSFSPWENSIKEVWDEVLSTRIVHISGQNYNAPVIQPSSDFFQVGGSSILMIKLKALLEVQFGATVSMPDLFHSSTLSRMATLVANAAEASQNTASSSATASSFFGPTGAQPTINWDLEIASMADGLPQPKSIFTLSDQRQLNGMGGLLVVLTGATGFVGRHLLSHLVQDPRVAEVHCLAIRSDENGNARHVSIKSEKIVEYVGDLSSLNLGLTDSQFAFLAQHASFIIHNGADVSLLKTYRSLRRANVVSTRTLCEIAIPRRIPLHYVSTASVAKVIELDNEESLLEVPASPAVPELLNSVDGYASSKWVSEMLLEKVAEDNGLPVFIHRLAHVVGNDASELDAVGMLTKYSLLVGKMPRIKVEDVRGQWDFIMVQDMVRDLIKSAVESAIDGSNPPDLKQQKQGKVLIFMNHCSDMKVPHEKFGKYLEDMAGRSLQDISMTGWLAEASGRGLHPLVQEFFAAFDNGRGKMVLPIIAKGVK
ncbi:hybrid PKS-NRPS PsoA [Talaromyces proteolyticus]|uniref:Hybrid PKS-NRPS PsoA n=1 Tax=Talaromyces proteolyticus TaxID=1131652 RepID=A0AAD4PTP0_9EURO|nr:hybrid PKS-NRPS PsoA [Talaromyces proteolyticus]KAH8689029.1 hybrid PKS-NRPS PsoA [Talaromyces proteolyticus]